MCVCFLVGNEFLNVLQTNFMLHITLYCFASAWRNQQDDRTLPGTYRAITFSVSCETLTSNSSACLICFSFYYFLFFASIGYNAIPIHFFLWRNSPIRLGHLIVEVSRSHPIGHTHTHAQTLLWTNDKLVADGAVYRHTTKARQGHHNLKRIRKKKKW